MVNSYKCCFYVAIDKSVYVHVGGPPITVNERQRVTINCSILIDRAINNGFPNPDVRWYKDGTRISNGTEVNVIISKDERLCIITDTLVAVGGQVGNDGNYTCEVCSNNTCIYEPVIIHVCGKWNN